MKDSFGKKLMHVDLVVNWFESHRVVGPIHTAFLEYKQFSKLRYVDANATVAIIGPTELANRWLVDELTFVAEAPRQQKVGFRNSSSPMTHITFVLCRDWLAAYATSADFFDRHLGSR